MVFKFDIPVLCELIEQRPCLWDKRNVSYKNKIQREKAWEEVFRFLDEEYDGKSSTDKRETGEKIIGKWTNIRDAFMRSLRSKGRQIAKKNYIYSEHLLFLLASQESGHTESSTLLDESSEPGLESEIEEDTTSYSSNLRTPTPAEKEFAKQAVNSKRRRNKDSPTDIEKEIVLEIKKPKLEEAKCTFFTSFEDYITDMSETEKLKLHSDILKSISEIKASRAGPVPLYCTYTCTTSDNVKTEAVLP